MKYIVFCLFVLTSSFLKAQDLKKDIEYSKIHLEELLDILETTYDVKFSYSPNLIEDTKVSVLLKTATLDQVLKTIEIQSPIFFKNIELRYYILKEKEKTSICGYLKDKNDLLPIKDAAIVIGYPIRNGTTSDSLGYFKLRDIYTTDTIQIKLLGYQTKKIAANSLKEKTCTDYFLNQENFNLDEVVVQEYLSSGILKLRDGGVKITPNNIEILSGLVEPDIFQNTQLLPGIESPSEKASDIFIRGGTPDQNLILWDGIKMYNSDHFFGELSAINPYIVKEAKVYRSGAKARYGDRVSGIIDIQTTDTIPSRTKGGLGVNFTHADAFIITPISKNLGLQFSVRRSITDIIFTPTFNKLSTKVFQNTRNAFDPDNFKPETTTSSEQFRFSDISLKLISRLSEKDQLTFSSILTKNKLDYSYSDTELNKVTSDKLDVENVGITTVWKRNWAPKVSTNAQIYYSQYNFTYDGFEKEFDEVTNSSKQNEIKELGLSLELHQKITKNFNYNLGYQFFTNNVNFNLNNDFFIEENNKSNDNNQVNTIYNEINYTPNNWYFDLGLRSSYYKLISSVQLEPRLYIENKLTENFRLKASLEVRNQTVSQIIEFSTLDFGLDNQVWALADDDQIPLLKSDQFTLGSLWNNKGWFVDIESYFKEVKGLTSIGRGFQDTEVNFSEGESNTFGIDFLVKKKFKNYATWLSYTYSSTNFIFENINNGDAFRGNNDVTNSLSWSHFYKWNAIQFSLGWKYRTGIPYTKALSLTETNDELFIDYETLNSATLPNYHRLDVSILYDFKLSKKENANTVKVGVSVLNVYNRKNILGITYDIFTTIDNDDNLKLELGKVTKYSLGITPNILFRLNF